MTNVAVLINPADDTQGRIIHGELNNMVFLTVWEPLDDAIEKAKGFLLANEHADEKALLSSTAQAGYDLL